MKRFSIVVFFVASLFTGLTSIGHAGGHLPDLVETAVKGEKFKTLVAALGAAGLVETLKGEGPCDPTARCSFGDTERGRWITG